LSPEQKQAATEQLRRETSGLPRAVDLAKSEVKAGSDPKYVAAKYDLGPDFVAACEEWKRRQEAMRGETERSSAEG
jgi:hypothetical protein